MFAAAKEPNRDRKGAGRKATRQQGNEATRRGNRAATVRERSTNRAVTVRERNTNRAAGACCAARLVLTTALLCAHPAAQAIAPPDTNEVTATTLSDVAVRGCLRTFSLEDGLRMEPSGDVGPVIRPADEVVQIVVHHEPRWAVSPEQRIPVEVRLVGGDRLFGEPVQPQDDREHNPAEETVLFETAVFGVLEVPLPLIERWVNTTHNRTAGDALERKRNHRAKTPSLDDRLLLSNGDVVHGILLAIDDRQLTFESDGIEMTVPHSQVAAVDLISEAHSSGLGLRARVTFVDGSRVTTDELVCSGDGLGLTLFDGPRRTVRLDHVAHIDIVGGRWVRITELPPISVQHTPMLSLPWSYVENANVLGGPMRIANRVFEHGVGVHSESSLMYDLAGEYRWFVTLFGIDDSAGGAPALADVTAEIRVDGQVRHRREHVTPGKLWGPIRIDVGGAARIELRTLFGENASIQDRFNWADAGLIRAAPPAE